MLLKMFLSQPSFHPYHLTINYISLQLPKESPRYSKTYTVVFTLVCLHDFSIQISL